MDSSTIYGSETDQYDKKIKMDHDATLEEEMKKAQADAIASQLLADQLKEQQQKEEAERKQKEL